MDKGGPPVGAALVAALDDKGNPNDTDTNDTGRNNQMS